MNENLKMGPNGLRLLMDFEKGDDSVPLSENGAALAPYVCPGDELTIGFGCTHWFDGEPVQIHHRLEGEADALNLLMLNLTGYEDAVRGALEREATQNQFDAMVCLCFNIGISAFLGSSVLKSFNAGRMEDAAANFGLWTGSTTARPRKKHITDPAYEAKRKQDHKGLWRWVGPEGQYCSYMLRLLGLLGRHYAEALLFMGRDHRRTLRSSTAIQLVLEPTAPADAEWDAGKGRWIDKVRYRTPFKDVYAVAYDDRLPEATQPAPEAKPAQATPPESKDTLVLTKDMQAAPDTRVPAAAGGAPETSQPPVASPAPVSVSKPSPSTSPAEKGGVSATAAAPPEHPVPGATVKPPLPAPVPPPPMPPSVQVNSQNDMGTSTKVMYRSKRFWGGVLIITGRIIIALDVTGHFAAPVRAFIGDGVLMDWMTGVIVTMIGELILDRGEKKAEGPMDTPKRVALATPSQ